MEKRSPIILVVILLVVIYIFNRAQDEYPFPNAAEPVASVELIHNQNSEGFGIDESNFEILCVWTKKRAGAFWSEFRRCRQTGVPNPFGDMGRILPE